MEAIVFFMWYMFNKWNIDEATALFGEDLGHHIYHKWFDSGDTLRWFGNLDNECRQKVVERAFEIYQK